MYNSTKINVIKLLFAMTRCAFLVTIASMTLTGVLMAAGVRSQNLNDTKITLTTKSTTLAEVLGKIEQQTEFSFSYAKKVGEMQLGYFQANNKTLAQVLKDLAEARHLRFTQLGDLIAVSELPAPAKPGRITGRVTDSKTGETLIGVSIRAVNQPGGAVSNQSGIFSLECQPGVHQVILSYIGYKQATIADVVVKEGEETPLNVML